MIVTAAQVQAVTKIPPATLRSWVQRGKVRRYTRDGFDSDDVAREFHRWAKTQRTGDDGRAA